MTDFSRRRILILEEQLQGRSSHHFEYLYDLAGDARKSGFEVSILCNRRTPPDLTDSLNARGRLFGVSNNTLHHIRGHLKRRLTVVWGTIANAWIILRELSQSPKQDLILVTTAWIPHVVSLLPAALLQRRKMDKIALQFLCSWNMEQARSRRQLSLLRWLLGLMRRLHANVTCFVQTQLAAKDLAGAGNLTVRILPEVAHPIAESTTVRAQNSNGIVTFGFFGFARHEQGADVLQEAIKIFLAEHPQTNARFCILWPSGGFRTPDGKWVDADDALEKTGKVQFIREIVFGERLLDLLLRTDWVLLPYRAATYARRSSRVAADAACRGIPAIYTRNTPQENVFIQFGAGIGIPDGDSVLLARAFDECCQKNTEFKQLAMEKVPIAQKAFSAGAFWEAVGIMGQKDSGNECI